jgi:hypothetical protein
MSNVAIVSVDSFTNTSWQLDRIFEPYTVAAALRPALRAARVDPLVTLRQD